MQSKKYVLYIVRKKSIENVSEEVEILDQLDKKFKLAILNMSKELKETMYKGKYQKNVSLNKKYK